MLIRDMSHEACLDFLAHRRLARIACTHEGQPYITPIYFVHHSGSLFSFSTVGQKIEWMRANPLVCVEADEVESTQNWKSVIALGRYEELTPTAHAQARQLAYSLLQEQKVWWQPGYVKTVLQGKERPLEPVYFRIYLHRVTGHYATPD